MLSVVSDADEVDRATGEGHSVASGILQALGGSRADALQLQQAARLRRRGFQQRVAQAHHSPPAASRSPARAAAVLMANCACQTRLLGSHRR